MKELFRDKKLLTCTSIFLAAAIAAVCFWQYHSPISVEASGIVSIEVGQGPGYEPGEEIIAERTENIKKLYLGIDSYALDIAVGAVHYRDDYSDEKEQWKDIDLTFEDSRITRAPYILTVDQDNRSLTVYDKKTEKTSSLRLCGIGNEDAGNIEKTAPAISEGKIQWDNMVDGLDVAVTARNTSVSFDWIIKDENAPHEVEFEIEDGGIPVIYQGRDADGKEVEVEVAKNDGKVTERIEKGGKYPILVNPVIDVGINTGPDDCRVHWNGSSWAISTTGTALAAGYLGPDNCKVGAGLRFSGVTIPASAFIISSHISFRCPLDLAGSGANTRITGNKEVDPAAWSTIEDYQSRRGTVAGGADDTRITTARVDWDNIEDWYYPDWYSSPDISAVIQELVDAHAPGNEAIALFWDDHDDRSVNNLRNSYSCDNGGPTNAPMLHIEYGNIANTPSGKDFGVVEHDSVVSTGLGYFNITNSSVCSINVTISGTDITGGTTWTLSDTATPGASTCGLKAGLNGGSYDVIVRKTAPYNTLISGLAGGASQGWGLQILAPTQYTDAVQKTGTVTLTATVN